ncbi:MAG TPA: hypothetical protein ACFYD9_02935 [Candidatus Wunengus sp. YC64]
MPKNVTVQAASPNQLETKFMSYNKVSDGHTQMSPFVMITSGEDA